MTKIYKDADNNIVNVGDWDFKMKPKFDDNNFQEFDEDNNPVLIASNLIPEGVNEYQVNVFLDEDGRYKEN
jgi:hypothetical protein